MKILKKIMLIIAIVFSVILVFALCFVGYLQFSYYRIGDTIIDINNNQDELVETNEEYSITTYNIGFGAYDRNYSFFMDKGYMADGSKTKGKYGKGVSKENTLKNTKGSISILESLSSDFMILQEVDTKSTRSYKINQKDIITQMFPHYSYSYAVNFHSSYLPYPILDMHGKSNSGILTMSRFEMDYSYRYELPIDESFFNKFFDLDRCINLVRYKIANSDKMLTIISVHLSAYDKGGVYRRKQIELLSSLMHAEYDNGNYVIVGGDFNHDIASGGSNFPTTQLKPDWIQVLSGEEFGNNFKIVSDNTNPSCRDADIPWKEGETYATVVDGFIISDNIELISVENIIFIGDRDTNFMYSDHNPVNMKFKLK